MRINEISELIFFSIMGCLEDSPSMKHFPFFHENFFSLWPILALCSHPYSNHNLHKFHVIVCGLLTLFSRFEPPQGRSNLVSPIDNINTYGVPKMFTDSDRKCSKLLLWTWKVKKQSSYFTLQFCSAVAQRSAAAFSPCNLKKEKMVPMLLITSGRTLRKLPGFPYLPAL